MSDNNQIEAESYTAASMAQLKRLKLSQRGHRSAVAGFVDEAKEIIADADMQDKSIDRLEQLARNARLKMQGLQTLHAKIMNLVDEIRDGNRSRGSRHCRRLSSSIVYQA